VKETPLVVDARALHLARALIAVVIPIVVVVTVIIPVIVVTVIIVTVAAIAIIVTTVVAAMTLVNHYFGGS
jgi:hypothetical protein